MTLGPPLTPAGHPCGDRAHSPPNLWATFGGFPFRKSPFCSLSRRIYSGLKLSQWHVSSTQENWFKPWANSRQVLMTYPHLNATSDISSSSYTPPPLSTNRAENTHTHTRTEGEGHCYLISSHSSICSGRCSRTHSHNWIYILEAHVDTKTRCSARCLERIVSWGSFIKLNLSMDP